MTSNFSTVSRLEAKASGLKRYFTGKPCKNGHVCERKTVNGACVQCVYSDPKMAEYKAAYCRKNPEKRASSCQGYRERNRQKTNLAALVAHRKRKNALASRLAEQHQDEIKAIYWKAQAWRELSGIEFHVDHVVPLLGKDVCGLHVPWNLQVISARKNRQKSNRHVG